MGWSRSSASIMVLSLLASCSGGSDTGGGGGGGHSSPQLAGSHGNLFLSIEKATGATTLRTGPGLAGFRDLRALAFDTNTNTLFGIDGFTGQLVRIDPATGAATAVGPLGILVVDGLACGLGFDSNTNTLYGSIFDPAQNADELVTIDPATGSATVVGPIGFQDVFGLAFDPNTNTLFGTDAFGADLIEIDPATGAGTFVSMLPTPGTTLAFDPNTNALYSTNNVKIQSSTM